MYCHFGSYNPQPVFPLFDKETHNCSSGQRWMENVRWGDTPVSYKQTNWNNNIKRRIFSHLAFLCLDSCLLTSLDKEPIPAATAEPIVPTTFHLDHSVHWDVGSWSGHLYSSNATRRFIFEKFTGEVVQERRLYTGVTDGQLILSVISVFNGVNQLAFPMYTPAQ